MSGGATLGRAPLREGCQRVRQRCIVQCLWADDRTDGISLTETVIHEATLRIRVGDRAATRAQLFRILELSEVDHVVVRVIPFELDGFGGAGSAMVYAGGPVPQLDTMVRDSPNGPVFVDAAAQLSRYRTLFRRVEAVSLDPGRSRDFIHRLAKEL